MALNPEHNELNVSAIEHHNKLRALHGSPKLTIDWELAKSAQAYADNLAKTNSFAHSKSDGAYGENLASSFNSRADYVFSGAAATQNWYDEIKDYKFGQEQQQNGKIGHFSQVVWKDTKVAGFGRAKNSKGMFVIVGQYKPAGNFIGHYMENINAPSGKAPPLEEKVAASKAPTAAAVPKATSDKQIKPSTTPKSKDDVLVKSCTKTGTANNKKTVEVIDTYKTPAGKTYEVKKVTQG